jgi:deazaflavin-dependent oxidoreductase (nitroreductase family)
MTRNDFVTFILRTPLHVFLGNTMLITVTGRKTGQKYSTPVGFYREGDTLWVISSRDRTWWRNVKNGANVSLW